tara:strand:- start:2023 stop:2424 length:402 start_codon:yes stop_codon:yes gene_type:complete
MYQASKAVIYFNNHFYLQLRDNNPNILYPNKWCFFGGRLIVGEKPEECLIRELKEEISFNPENFKLIYDWFNSETKTQIYFYLIKVNLFRIFNVNEGQKGEWVNINDLNKLLFAPDIKAMKEFIKTNSLDVFE